MGRVCAREKLRGLIETIPGRTIAARLRKLMPDIERRINEGVQMQEIVDALNQHGGMGREVKLATLRSYLFRYRRAQREGRRRCARWRLALPAVQEVPSGLSPTLPVQPARVVLPRGPSPLASTTSSAVTQTVLRESRDEEIDLETFAELAKSNRRRKGS